MENMQESSQNKKTSQRLSGADQQNFAIEYQIKEVALNQEAEEREIKISDEEAVNYATKVREFIYNGENTPNKQSAKENIEDTIAENNLTEKQYWENYILSSYKHLLAKQELKDSILAGIDDSTKRQKKWSRFVDNVVKEYKSENSKAVNDFTSAVK